MDTLDHYNKGTTIDWDNKLASNFEHERQLLLKLIDIDADLLKWWNSLFIFGNHLFTENITFFCVTFQCHWVYFINLLFPALLILIPNILNTLFTRYELYRISWVYNVLIMLFLLPKLSLIAQYLSNVYLCQGNKFGLCNVVFATWKWTDIDITVH